jgi:hypothetical protein
VSHSARPTETCKDHFLEVTKVLDDFAIQRIREKRGHEINLSTNRSKNGRGVSNQFMQWLQMQEFAVKFGKVKRNNEAISYNAET